MRCLMTTAGALLALAACAACTDGSLTTEPRALVAPAIAHAPTPDIVAETSTDVWARVITGETGPGSSYQLYLPREWNGTAIFYSHGIRDVLEPVSLRDQDNLGVIRENLGRLGYAVAYSSYSENGFAEKDGAQRTHQLRGLFTSVFGTPSRSLLVGHSLGGLIALELADRFSSQYDGVAAMCSIAGGSQAEIDHVVNVRLLFDLFYPGILPGQFDNPLDGGMITPAQQAQIVGAITANPTGLFIMASIAQTGLDFNPASPQAQTQLVTSLITALTFHARGRDNVLSFTNGKFPFDNSQTVYSAAAIPLLPPNVLGPALAQVNATVPRTSGDPSALNYLDHHFTPAGSLAIPTITLHNRWDPLVPFFHEPLFASRVSAAGASALLVQRVRPAFGHCNFDVADQIQTIVDLDTWIATGVRPAA